MLDTIAYIPAVLAYTFITLLVIILCFIVIYVSHKLYTTIYDNLPGAIIPSTSSTWPLRSLKKMHNNDSLQIDPEQSETMAASALPSSALGSMSSERMRTNDVDTSAPRATVIVQRLDSSVGRRIRTGEFSGSIEISSALKITLKMEPSYLAYILFELNSSDATADADEDRTPTMPDQFDADAILEEISSRQSGKHRRISISTESILRSEMIHSVENIERNPNDNTDQQCTEMRMHRIIKYYENLSNIPIVELLHKCSNINLNTSRSILNCLEDFIVQQTNKSK